MNRSPSMIPTILQLLSLIPMALKQRSKLALEDPPTPGSSQFPSYNPAPPSASSDGVPRQWPARPSHNRDTPSVLSARNCRKPARDRYLADILRSTLFRRFGFLTPR